MAHIGYEIHLQYKSKIWAHFLMHFVKNLKSFLHCRELQEENEKWLFLNLVCVKLFYTSVSKNSMC